MRKHLVAFAILVSSAGCVTTYKSSQVQGQLDQANRQVEQNTAAAAQAIAQREGFLKSLYASGADRTKPPYNELEKDLREVRKSYARLETQKKRYYAIAAPLQGAIKAKDRISSRDPEYKTLATFRDKSRDLIDDYRKATEELQNRVGVFDAATKREKIYEIDAQTLRKQVADGSALAESRLSKIRGDIKNVRQRVAEEPEAKRAQHEAALTSMEQDLNSIDKLVAEVRQIEARFRQEVGDRAKVVVGPQMVTYTVATQLETKAGEIQKVVEHFNQTAQTGLK